MTCNCPKCSTELDIDLSAIPTEGSFHNCTSCHANFVVRTESFARRALYKGTEIACAECGNPPGSSIYCQSCHAIYPKLLIIATSSVAKKQLGILLNSLTLLKNFKIKIPAKTHHEARHATVTTTATTAKEKGKKGHPAQLATVLAVILVGLIVGGYAWYQNKVATEYAQQYVRALFGLKTARDVEVAIGNRVTASWKAGASSALTAAEQKSTASARKDIDMVLKRISTPPGKFKANSDAISKLAENFNRLHATVTAPAGTSDIYAGAVKKADDDFLKSARELKAGLTGKIADQFEESKKKYKTLQEF